MRAVVQRVRSASVSVEGRETGRIGGGLLVLLGIGKGDGAEAVSSLASKVVGLRIFPDDRHPMNASLAETGGSILLVSQFTLLGDCRKGRRPSFAAAAPPEEAERLYRDFAAELGRLGFPPQEGIFGAMMLVSLENDGPVTILLDSERRF
jgi:D-aminoacyl-tRNA deacylase